MRTVISTNKEKFEYQYIHGWSFKVYFNDNTNAKALTGVCLIKMGIFNR